MLILKDTTLPIDAGHHEIATHPLGARDDRRCFYIAAILSCFSERSFLKFKDKRGMKRNSSG